MPKQSAADILRLVAADFDRLGVKMATKRQFADAVRLFMKAEECRRNARVADAFDLLRRRE